MEHCVENSSPPTGLEPRTASLVGQSLTHRATTAHTSVGCKDMYTYIGWYACLIRGPGRVAQSVGHLTRKLGVLGSIPGLATYFRFSFIFFKKGSCRLLAKVCA